MPTPSEYALEDALETITQRDCGDVRLRDYEAVELDEYIQSLHAKLANLDTAINEARLEGAKAMQDKAVKIAAPIQADVIRILDPQQVINESKTS